MAGVQGQGRWVGVEGGQEPASLNKEKGNSCKHGCNGIRLAFQKEHSGPPWRVHWREAHWRQRGQLGGGLSSPGEG